MKPGLTLLPMAFLLATAAAASPVLPAFDPANFPTDAAITHTYFPLKAGYLREYSGMVKDEAGDPTTERTVMQYDGPGPVIAGVATVVMSDQAFVGDLNIERTKDYYAQDKDGNVWYMGEDVQNIHHDTDDKISGTDTKGTWRAGVNGALPGYQMAADPKPGFAYEQEHSPADKAMDIAEIMAVDATQDGKLGPYANVIKVYETSSIETDLREIKYYAPGVGLIGEDEAVDLNRENPEAHFDLIRMEN